MTGGLQRLREASAAFDALARELTDGEWRAPAPCDGWSVADVAGHVTRGDHLFAAARGLSARG